MNERHRKVGFLALVAMFAMGFGAGCDDSESAGEAGDEVEQTIGVLEMETFLTNINDPVGARHARLRIKLAIVPEEQVAEIKADLLLMARLRDRILTLLTSKTYGQLNDAKGKEVFRKEILERLNPLLERGEVKEVLFSDFVVQ